MVAPVDAIDFPQRMKRALQAIGLVVLVVLFNLGLFVGVRMLISYHIIDDRSVYPPLILFLSFALSFAIILIVGLGEKVDTKNIKNEWIKKIGVSPLMIIVAVLLAILSAFSVFAGKIITADADIKNDIKKLDFMLANIGVTCVATSSPPQAEDLLTVIWGDKDYINDIKGFLTNEMKMRSATNPKITFIGKDDRDETTKLLFKYAVSKGLASEALSSDLDKEERWIGYTVKVKAPQITTSIPVPTKYNKDHRTRLFAIVAEPEPSNQAEVASLDAPIKSKASRGQKSILPLFQVGINPKLPVDDSQVADLDVKLYTNHSCWHIGGIGI